MATKTKSLTAKDASIVKAMLQRRDKQHDIAAFFSVNGGRVPDIQTGKTFRHVASYQGQLPPPGPYNVQDMMISREDRQRRDAVIANEIIKGCADMEKLLPADVRTRIEPVFQRFMECADRLEGSA